MARTTAFTCNDIQPLPAPATFEEIPPAEIVTSYAICRSIAQHYGRTFYLGSLLLPPAKRSAVWALYAFCRYADDLVDTSSDPARTLALLDSWEEQLLAAANGEQIAHPIFIAWADSSRRYPIPLKAASDLLAGLRMDLQINRYPSFEDLRLYCYRVASTVGLMTSAVIGYSDPVALEHAADLGIAMQLTNILRDVGEDGRHNRIYIPQEDLDYFGYEERRLLKGEITPAFIRLMDFQIERARSYYRLGGQGIRYLSADSRLSIMSSMLLYGKILDVIKRNRYEVFRKRAHLSTFAKIAQIPGVLLQLRRLERSS